MVPVHPLGPEPRVFGVDKMMMSTSGCQNTSSNVSHSLSSRPIGSAASAALFVVGRGGENCTTPEANTPTGSVITAADARSSAPVLERTRICPELVADRLGNRPLLCG